MGVPTNGWFIISINGKSTKMDDLGVPLFQKTPISSHQCGHQEWWPAVAGQALQLAVFAWFEATPWNGHNLQPQNDHKMFTRLYTLNIYIFNHIHHIESYKLNTIDVSCYPKDAVPSWILSLQPMAGEPGRQQITEMRPQRILSFLGLENGMSCRYAPCMENLPTLGKCWQIYHTWSIGVGALQGHVTFHYMFIQ